MEIIIYNSSSFGGCFDYGKALAKTYARAPEVHSVEWWIPKNASCEKSIPHKKLFLTDAPRVHSKWKKQLHFLFRVWLNPIILAWHLRKRKQTWLIFNDFEQLSAWFWVPLFKLFFKRKHHFCIILHDPDRDAYPPSLRFTRWSMKKILSLMNVAIYHDFLPEKPYYQSNNKCIYLDLPHGFYPMPEPDMVLFEMLSACNEPGKILMAILGNIREEKNYHLAIQALSSLPQHILIIAGKPSNARVNVQTYKDLAKKIGVEKQVIWVEKFLTEEEMSAVIEVAHVILLNYAVSFTSQSGILNVVAPFRKELIVSDGPSSLASIIRKFGVGELVEPGSVSSLVKALSKLQSEELEMRQHWEAYLQYASWENHVSKALKVFRAFMED